MGFQTSGRLHAIFDTKQVTERFQKREFVVETADNPSYPLRYSTYAYEMAINFVIYGLSY